mmetsp:Transcript_24383/g.75172  ORF Transcript_24383/g.75172 Transcript_24383/m.75172 type:complete len:217 (+) Transcript_24383:76-726(+)
MARTILALAVGASALVAPPQSSKPVVAMKGIQTPPILTRETLPTLPLAETMPGVGLETGGRLWDPMGFATFSDESLIWFRACELKHGRVAMLATAGWIVNGLHFSFPGTIDYETSFASLAAKPPLEAWAGVPLGGKLQILGWIFCVEAASEMQKPHYLKGGDFVTYDWVELSKNMSPETLRRKQEAELKNGRLAMVGFMSFLAANNIAGSVPMVPH